MPRNAVASSRRDGLRPGSLHEPSCSRCATSRTSTFVARCRRIELSSVSVGLEGAAGERPCAGIRLARALPEERLQAVVAHLEHDRERDLRRAVW